MIGFVLCGLTKTLHGYKQEKTVASLNLLTPEREDPDAFSGCTKNEVKQRVTQLNSTL